MAIWHVAPLRFAPSFGALGVCEHIWPFSLRDIWATLLLKFLSPKWLVTKRPCPQHMPHIMIVNRLEANKERFRPEGFDQIRPHSVRFLQFDQKVRPLSFLPENFDLFTATQNLIPKINICAKPSNIALWCLLLSSLNCFFE